MVSRSSGLCPGERALGSLISLDLSSRLASLQRLQTLLLLLWPLLLHSLYSNRDITNHNEDMSNAWPGKAERRGRCHGQLAKMLLVILGALQCFLQDELKWILWRGCPQGARYSDSWSGAMLSFMLIHDHLHNETFTSYAVQYLD